MLQMRYVLAVAESASFTRAAERCHVAQSALSHQVAHLEKELGAWLFERTSRRVRLTVGSIPTVTAVDLPAVLRDHRLSYPQVRISLRAGSSERLVEQVRAGQLDAAFLGVLPGFRTHGVRDRNSPTGGASKESPYRI
nr:LysR family transcriptional regulator [Streptomyces aureocirculatus]